MAGAVVSWIIAGIAAAWSLLSGAASVAGAAALASALALLPAKMGEASAAWLSVANFYIPLNEAVSLFGIYLAMAGFLKIAKWSILLKK